MFRYHPAGCPRASISEGIARVISGPEHPERDFVKDRISYAALYNLAEGIRRDLPGECRAVCLCTEDKAMVAAALLAALACGFTLVLPHAASRRAVAEVRQGLDVPGGPNGPSQGPAGRRHPRDSLGGPK